jgi:hypothetical protein
MKSVGEVMAIGRSFLPKQYKKACQSLENNAVGLGYYGKRPDACRRNPRIYQSAEMGPDISNQGRTDGGHISRDLFFQSYQWN